MYKLNLEEAEEPESIANVLWIIEKAREFQTNIYFCFIDYTKVFACVDHNKLWKILEEMAIADHLTCLLRNPYTGQEATVRTGHGMNATKIPLHLHFWKYIAFLLHIECSFT